MMKLEGRSGKQLFVTLAITIIAFLSGCSGNVKTAYDTRVDFSEYHTWCWLQGCEFTFSGPSFMNDSLIRTRIKNAITEEMASHGFRYDSAYPDLLLDFHVTVSSETAMQYHPQYNQDFPQMRDFEETEIHFLKGTLIIDMVDHASNQMVWRSVAIGYYEHHPEISEENIRRGIHEVLKKFPPRVQEQ